MGREKDTHTYLPHMCNKTLEDTYKASNWLFMRMGDKGSGKILHCMFFYFIYFMFKPCDCLTYSKNCKFKNKKTSARDACVDLSVCPPLEQITFSLCTSNSSSVQRG